MLTHSIAPPRAHTGTRTHTKLIRASSNTRRCARVCVCVCARARTHTHTHDQQAHAHAHMWPDELEGGSAICEEACNNAT